MLLGRGGNAHTVVALREDTGDLGLTAGLDVVEVTEDLTRVIAVLGLGSLQLGLICGLVELCLGFTGLGIQDGGVGWLATEVGAWFADSPYEDSLLDAWALSELTG